MTYLKALETIVREHTQHQCKAIALMYDEEDGYFITTIDCGTYHFPVLDRNTSIVRKNLKEAVIAAVEYHNEERKKWYLEHREEIKLP